MWKEASRLVLITRDQSFALQSLASVYIARPALLTKISSFPLKWSPTVFIRFSRSSRTVRLQGSPDTLYPLLFQSCKHWFSSSGSRAQVYTSAPNFANSSTIASPIPRAPPVTRTVLPLKHHDAIAEGRV
nr:Uncharacterised protein [Ipomoea batatas]